MIEPRQEYMDRAADAYKIIVRVTQAFLAEGLYQKALVEIKDPAFDGSRWYLWNGQGQVLVKLGEQWSPVVVRGEKADDMLLDLSVVLENIEKFHTAAVEKRDEVTRRLGGGVEHAEGFIAIISPVEEVPAEVPDHFNLR